MDHVKGLLELIEERLGPYSNSDIVVGTPIELGEATVVPLCRVSIGLGAGGGIGSGKCEGARRGKDRPGKGIGGGTGGGATLRPVAVAVFTEDDVEIVPIPNPKGKIDKLLDYIPDLVERITEATEGKKGGKAAIKLGGSN